MIDHITIGGIRYRVEEVHKLTGGNSDGEHVWLNGTIKLCDALIQIEQDMDAGMKLATLWHEAIHGIFEQAGQEVEEKFVKALGYAIVPFLRANPELVNLTIDNEA